MYDPTHNRKEPAVLRGATQAPVPYASIAEDETSLSLRDIFRIIWKRMWAVILVTLIVVGTAVGFSLWQTPVYEASVKMLVGQESGDDQPANLAGSVEGLQQLTQTMVEAIDSRPVAEEVIRRLGLQMTPGNLLGNLTVEEVGGTQFILLSYRGTDPERAQEIVNSVGDVSSERIAEAGPSASDITVTVWEYAVVPDAPVSPDPVRNGLLALALGLMLGLGLAFLLEYLDDSWRSPEEVEQVSGVPTFGVIPRFEAVKSRKKG